MSSTTNGSFLKKSKPFLIALLIVGILFFGFTIGGRIILGCMWHATVRAWHDVDGDGHWDEDESPLKDVTFYVDDTLNGDKKVGFDDATTSWEGYTTVSVWLHQCQRAHFEVYPKVPRGYMLTTDESISKRANQVGDEIDFGFTY